MSVYSIAKGQGQNCPLSSSFIMEMAWSFLNFYCECQGQLFAKNPYGNGKMQTFHFAPTFIS